MSGVLLIITTSRGMGLISRCQFEGGSNFGTPAEPVGTQRRDCTNKKGLAW